ATQHRGDAFLRDRRSAFPPLGPSCGGWRLTGTECPGLQAPPEVVCHAVRLEVAPVQTRGGTPVPRHELSPQAADEHVECRRQRISVPSEVFLFTGREQSGGERYHLLM